MNIEPYTHRAIDTHFIRVQQVATWICVFRSGVLKRVTWRFVRRYMIRGRLQILHPTSLQAGASEIDEKCAITTAFRRFVSRLLMHEPLPVFTFQGRRDGWLSNLVGCARASRAFLLVGQTIYSRSMRQPQRMGELVRTRIGVS